MREIRSYGSVRGVAGDRYPYRDPSNGLRPGSPVAQVEADRLLTRAVL